MKNISPFERLLIDINTNPLLRKKSIYISINQLIFLIAGQLYLLVDYDKWKYILECMQDIRQKLLDNYNISNIDGWSYFYVSDNKLYETVKGLILNHSEKLNIDPDCLAQNVCHYYYFIEIKNNIIESYAVNYCELCVHENDDSFTQCDFCLRNANIEDFYEPYTSWDEENDNSLYCKYECLKIGNLQCCKSCEKIKDCNLVCLNIDNVDSCEYARNNY